MSGIVAARRQYFMLVQALEEATHCDIDDLQLAALIDGQYAGREGVSEAEASTMLLQVALRRGKPPA